MDDLITREEMVKRLQDAVCTKDARIAALEAEVARLKALGDGLAGYVKHNGLCGMIGGYNRCTCGLSAALAAWEKKDA